MNDYAINELERLLANLITIGTVTDTDYANAKVKVQVGDIVTDWLPFAVQRAGNDLDWWAPETSEQVIVFAPGGDLAQAFVSGAIYQTAFSAPASVETVRRVQFADGTIVEYDRSTSELTVNCVGKVKVIAATGIELDGLGAGQIKGSVQGDSLCAYTQQPHPHISISVLESP